MTLIATNLMSCSAGFKMYAKEVREKVETELECGISSSIPAFSGEFEAT